jgi:hypothetical protein
VRKYGKGWMRGCRVSSIRPRRSDVGIISAITTSSGVGIRVRVKVRIKVRVKVRIRVRVRVWGLVKV